MSSSHVPPVHRNNQPVVPKLVFPPFITDPKGGNRHKPYTVAPLGDNATKQNVTRVIKDRSTNHIKTTAAVSIQNSPAAGSIHKSPAAAPIHKSTAAISIHKSTPQEHRSSYTDVSEQEEAISAMPDVALLSYTSPVESIGLLTPATSSSLYIPSRKLSCFRHALQWCFSKMCNPERCIIDQHEVEIWSGDSPVSKSSSHIIKRSPSPLDNYIHRTLNVSPHAQGSPARKYENVPSKRTTPSAGGSAGSCRPVKSRGRGGCYAGSVRTLQNGNGLSKSVLSSRIS